VGSHKGRDDIRPKGGRKQKKINIRVQPVHKKDEQEKEKGVNQKVPTGDSKNELVNGDELNAGGVLYIDQNSKMDRRKDRPQGALNLGEKRLIPSLEKHDKEPTVEPYLRRVPGRGS